jgi:Pyruvate/2-oxoacid:ferredoxin oxidoreductase delta subunit
MDTRSGKPKAQIDALLCTGCQICLQICPRTAIYQRVPDDVAG